MITQHGNERNMPSFHLLMFIFAKHNTEAPLQTICSTKVVLCATLVRTFFYRSHPQWSLILILYFSKICILLYIDLRCDNVVEIGLFLGTLSQENN
jgi:hypothetical protein